MPLTLITAATDRPLTLEQAKTHLRADLSETAENELIEGLIAAAVDRVEAFTGRQLLEATWELQFDAWPCEPYIEIPKPPLRAVSSVKYLGTDGVETTLPSTDYQIDKPAGPLCSRGRVLPAYGTTWPTLRNSQPGAVKVRYTAGYGTEGKDVPLAIVQAMKLMIGSWYEHREDIVVGTIALTLPRAATAILKPYISRPVTRQVAA